MKVLRDHDLPVASSCQGDGVCGRCRIQILMGMEHISPAGDTEKILRDRNRLQKSERISCQVTVHGDILIDTAYW